MSLPDHCPSCKAADWRDSRPVNEHGSLCRDDWHYEKHIEERKAQEQKAP